MKKKAISLLLAMAMAFSVAAPAYAEAGPVAEDAAGSVAVEAPEPTMPIEETPAGEAEPADEAPDAAASAVEAPEVPAPAEETPDAPAPEEETPAEPAPAEEAPVEEAPAEDAPEEQAPAEEAPVEEVPAEGAPAEEPAPAALSADKQEQQAILDELLTLTPDVDYAEHSVLVFVDSEADAQAAADALGLTLEDFYGYAALLTCPGTVAETMRAALEDPRELPTLYPDRIYSAEAEASEQTVAEEPDDPNTLAWGAATNDPYRSRQWYLDAINVNAAWDQGVTGEGVYIAALDTGTMLDHQDLKVWRYWLSDELQNDKNDDKNPYDKHGQGTNVAGVINMQPNNGKGGVGIAYGATFDSIRVTDSKGNFTTSLVMGGITKAVYEKVSVLTVGGAMHQDPNGFLAYGIKWATDHGCVVVAPAGDKSQGVNFLPAHGDVIGVAACNSVGVRYGSTDARNVNILAPGVEIMTTSAKTGYSYATGSAVASAVVAGVAALCISADPDLRDIADIDKDKITAAQGRAFVEKVRKRLLNSVDSNGMIQVPGVVNSVNRPKVEAFVTRLYEVCLDRLPKNNEEANWVDKLLDGDMDGANAVYGFVFSKEFTSKNYCNSHYLDYLYQAIFGRDSDPVGKQDWLNRMANGMWREDVLEGFAGSTEFGQLCASYGIVSIKTGAKTGSIVPHGKYGTIPQGPCAVCGEKDGVTQFVERLYRVCFDREADAGGLADWTGKLWNHTASGTVVAHGFAMSEEMANLGLNDEQYVEAMYRAFFDREYDDAGKADWLNRMHAQGYDREQVFYGFAGSQEFDNLCKRYGITR